MHSLSKQCAAHMLKNPAANYQTQNYAWHYLRFLRHYYHRQGDFIAPWSDNDFRTIDDDVKQAEVRDSFPSVGCFPAFSGESNIAIGHAHTTPSNTQGKLRLFHHTSLE